MRASITGPLVAALFAACSGGGTGSPGSTGQDGGDGTDSGDAVDGSSATDGGDGDDASDGRDGDDASDGLSGEVPPETLVEPATSATEGLHVAPSGDDTTGDGSAAAPFKTVQHTLDNAAGEGAVILLHAGTYEEQVRIRFSNVTLQSAPGEKAHLTWPISIDENEPSFPIEVDAETTGVTLRGLEVSGGFYAVFLGSQWDYDDTPTDNLTANHVTIEDCVLHDSGRDVVKVPAGCDYVTIRRTEIYNSGMGYPPGTSVDDKNAEGIDAVNADYMLISDSHVHDSATSCIYVKGGSIGTVIERVRAERCGGLGLALGFDTSPEFFDTTVNPEYYESIGGTIRNSVVIDTALAGIALYASRDAFVLHNTVIRGGSAGHAGLYFGIATQDYDLTAGRPPNRNPTVIGNVVDQTGLDSPACFGIRHSVEDDIGIVTALEGPVTIADNLYWAGGSPCLFDDNRPDALLEGGDLAAWQAHGSGFDTRSRFENPNLDATGHLQVGSPAVDALDATTGVTYDIDGTARAAPFDLGADEL